MEYLLVGTIHEEDSNPLVCSSTLYNLAEIFKPDCIQVECGIDEYHLFKEKMFDSTSNSVEANFFSKYARKYNIDLTPIDMAGKSQTFYNSQYWKKENDIFSKIEILASRFEKIKEYFRLSEYIDEIKTKGSLSLLNSSFFDRLWQRSYEIYDNEIKKAVRKYYPKEYDFYNYTIELRNKRDNEIFKNIFRFSEHKNRIMILLGAGHAQPLRNRIEKISRKVKNKFRSIWEIKENKII